MSPFGRASASSTAPEPVDGQGQQGDQDGAADEHRVAEEGDAGDDQAAQAAGVDERRQGGGADQQHQRGADARDDDRYGQRQLDLEQDGQARHAHPPAGLDEGPVHRPRPTMVLLQHRQQRRTASAPARRSGSRSRRHMASSTMSPMAGAACPALATPTTSGAARRAAGRVSTMPSGTAMTTTTSAATAVRRTCCTARLPSSAPGQLASLDAVEVGGRAARVAQAARASRIASGMHQQAPSGGRHRARAPPSSAGASSASARRRRRSAGLLGLVTGSPAGADARAPMRTTPRYSSRRR